MTMDCKRLEMMRTYRFVVNFPLRTCAADEITAEAYNDVVNSHQGLAMTAEKYFRMLRNKALRCVVVPLDRWLKSLFIDRLLLGARA